jgi:hypothetical protein
MQNRDSESEAIAEEANVKASRVVTASLTFNRRPHQMLLR